MRSSHPIDRGFESALVNHFLLFCDFFFSYPFLPPFLSDEMEVLKIEIVKEVVSDYA